MPDAVVVGAGPNGLAAAVTLARAGLDVEVYERAPTIGGGARTLELTLPGFRHDLGSAVHPMGLASAFFRAFELDRRVEFAVPEVSYAHPLPGATGAAYRDLDRTAEALGRDGKAWRGLFAPLVEHIGGVSDFTGSQLLRIPHDPITAARFGLRALEQGSPLWNARFRDEIAPAMLAGVCAHSIGTMPSLPVAGAGLVLAAHAHARGWPIPIGGSQAIVDALAEDLVAHGGVIRTGAEISDLRELPDARIVLLDVSTRALVRIAGDSLPDGYRARIGRFAFGNGVSKVDFALSGPVPWRDEPARRTATLHLGGTRAQIQRAERDVAEGRVPQRPYALIAQPSVVDPSRAPAGKHTLWAYIHVPKGSDYDATEAVMRLIEESAPGFRDLIEASAPISAVQLEEWDPNFVGGDISSGALSLRQMAARPVLSTRPWRTPVRGLYLASSATPPATGVHGLCGYYAARTALADMFRLPPPPLGIGS